MSEPLKSCPFCGGEAEMRRDAQGREYVKCWHREGCETGRGSPERRTPVPVPAWPPLSHLNAEEGE